MRDLVNLHPDEARALGESLIYPEYCPGCDKHTDCCVCSYEQWAAMVDGQAPVTSENSESARERIPTREVPITSMREMLDEDELEAELAQHAEAGR